MNLGTFEYFKPYISKTSRENTAQYGNPTWEIFQSICEEDKNLQKEIITRFNRNTEMRRGFQEYTGFDGRFVYSFNFKPTPSTKISDLGEKENKKYDSSVFIKKAGNEIDKGKVCDLEEFLLEQGFQLKE